MHNLSSLVHKRKGNLQHEIDFQHHHTDFRLDDADLEVGKEERLSTILSLQSKSLTQSEIARKLCVNQSTISRELELLRKTASKKLKQYLKEDIPFEFLRLLKGSDELIKTTWQMVDDKQVSCKEKYNLLNLLDSLYTKRLQLIIGGNPRDGGPLNVKSCLNDLSSEDLYPKY